MPDTFRVRTSGMKTCLAAAVLAVALVGCHRTESSAPEAVASTRITAATPTVPPVAEPAAQPAAQPAAAAIAPKTKTDVKAKHATKDLLVGITDDKLTVCRGDDFTLTVPAYPGSQVELKKYDGLAKPRQRFQERAISPTIGAEKYTFSTKNVPETKKALIVEFVDQESNDHTPVKIDLIDCP